MHSTSASCQKDHDKQSFIYSHSYLFTITTKITKNIENWSRHHTQNVCLTHIFCHCLNNTRLSCHKSSDKEKAWFIVLSILHSNKQFVGLHHQLLTTYFVLAILKCNEEQSFDKFRIIIIIIFNNSWMANKIWKTQDYKHYNIYIMIFTIIRIWVYMYKNSSSSLKSMSRKRLKRGMRNYRMLENLQRRLIVTLKNHE